MKWVIVTGDSGGLGSEIVESILANLPYGVIGISRKHNDNVERLLCKHHGVYEHINIDFSVLDSFENCLKALIGNKYSIYGLVNNSAFAYDDIVTNANADNLTAMFAINVFAPVILTKFVIRNMLLNSCGGSIVNISSVCAHTGYKGLSMYAATKGAIEAFTINVAREWGAKGVRANCVIPGFMETDMSAGLSVEQKNRIYNRTSLKKPTLVQSAAEMASYLLSEKACSVTGSCFRVDAGTL